MSRAAQFAPSALPAANRPQGRKLTHLQALRAVAASLVVLDHSLDRLVSQDLLSLDWRPMAYHLGWMGVAVFFVTSGLIMYRTSGEDFGSARAARRFAVRRIVRVAPLYWIATLAYAVTKLGDLDPVALVKSLLFVPYPTAGESVMRPVLGVGWTLNYEMFFYALFAVALLLPRRIGLPALLVTLVGLVAAGGYAHSLWHYADPTTLQGFYTDPMLLLFAAGVLIGWVESRRKAVRRSVVHPLAASVLLLGVAAGLGAVVGVRFPLAGGWQLVFGALAVAVVYACTAGGRQVNSRGGRLLERAGDASYSTYLFHVFVVVAWFEVWFRLLPDGGPVGMAAYLTAAVVGANLAGWLLFRFVERPLTARLRRALDRPTLVDQEQVRGEPEPVSR